MNLSKFENNLGKKEECGGNIPVPRFGHTSTYVGDELMLLFGGAIRDAHGYTITADCYCLDMRILKWRLLATENTPKERAAHAAVCVENMQIVIYGGATGGGNLSSDDLYVLDMKRDPNLMWLKVPVSGNTPGQRYGHSLAFYKPNILLYGGNDGTKTLGDAWMLNVEAVPFTWIKIEIDSGTRCLCPRVYHTAEMCRHGPADGMMVVFGGRGVDGKPLGDTWGMRQHRDGRWDWIEAPNKKGIAPEPRFQHTCVIYNNQMIILGGRTGSDYAKPMPTMVYDTDLVEWCFLDSIGKFRHSTWIYKNIIMYYGGFSNYSQQGPTDDLCSIEIGVNIRLNSNQLEYKPMNNQESTYVLGEQNENIKPSDSSVKRSIRDVEEISKGNNLSQLYESQASNLSKQKDLPDRPSRRSSEVRLSAHAFAGEQDAIQCGKSFTKIEINSLEEEGKKIDKHNVDLAPSQASQVNSDLSERIIRQLLNPKASQLEIHTRFNTEAMFTVSREDMYQLLNEVIGLFSSDESLLRVNSPIKVYGDIHGQYYDLMRMFHLYKAPLDDDIAESMGVEGDLDSVDYLFLGDYVDRGTNSLETITLLFALKLRYPNRIHLIRGNHEDSGINCVYGFLEECRRRLYENPNKENSIWHRFNLAFEYMPLGATVDNSILAIHGGIGSNLHKVAQIAQIQRPLQVAPIPLTEMDRIVTDILWSDPTDNDCINGIIPNDLRDPDHTAKIVRFGPDRVRSFLEANELSLIIRAHECVMDGFERFAGGKLITVFSATNYCNHYLNAGAMIFIKRDRTLVPKLIYPSQNNHKAFPTWETKSNDSRPPTPPRSTSNITEAAAIRFQQYT